MEIAIAAVPLELATTEAHKIDLSRAYSLAEFLALPNNGKEYELVKGKLIEMSGPSGTHALIVSKLSRYLDEFVTNKQLGFIFSNGAFVLDSVNEPNTARRPDLAFVSNTHLIDVDFNAALPVVPDLAIEVVSPTDFWFAVLEKVAVYQQVGVSLIWVIVPPEQQLFVYSAGQKVKMLLADDELEGQDIIPDFKLKVSLLFDWQNRLKQLMAQK